MAKKHRAAFAGEGQAMSKKTLTAAQGVEAGCILFELNSRAEAIDNMARGAMMPEQYRQGAGAELFRAEWRAFVHAVVTAGLMQYAPNSVLTGYLRQTARLLALAAPSPAGAARATEAAVTQFVDGPFAQYMPLLAREQQAACPELFCGRLARQLKGGSMPDNRAKARLAAIMAMVISAIWDKLEQYEILAD